MTEDGFGDKRHDVDSGVKNVHPQTKRLAFVLTAETIKILDNEIAPARDSPPFNQVEELTQSVLVIPMLSTVGRSDMVKGQRRIET